MSTKQVVKINDNGKARIVSTRRWFELLRRMSGNSAALSSHEGACEEACAENGGVEICGETFAYCKDGTAWLINP